MINLAGIYPQRLGEGRVSSWQAIARRMLVWLSAMAHPDGEIVLFNDAAFEVAPRPVELFGYADRLGISLPSSSQKNITHLDDSGYLRVSTGPAVAFLDTAFLGPDYLPGHGHADSLTFDLSIWGRRVIVDSGISTYDLSVERERQRGTLAHNTVIVDGENSSEVWGSFRVARRAKPLGLSNEKEGDLIIVRCSHNGYKRLPGSPIHSRNKSLRIEDKVSGGFTKAVSRYHFHPEVTALSVSTSEGEAQLADGRKFRWTISGGEGHLIEATYHPEFGQIIQNQCLEVCFKGSTAAAEFSWV